MDGFANDLVGLILGILLGIVGGVMLGAGTIEDAIKEDCELIGYFHIDDTVYECTKREADSE